MQLKEGESDKQTQCFQGSQETTVPCTQLVLVGKKLQVHTAPGDINIGKQKLTARKIYDRSQLPETSTAPAPVASSPPTSSSEACLDTTSISWSGTPQKDTVILPTLEPSWANQQSDFPYLSTSVRINGQQVRMILWAVPGYPDSYKIIKKAYIRNIGRRCTIEGFIRQNVSPSFGIFALYPPKN